MKNMLGVLVLMMVLAVTFEAQAQLVQGPAEFSYPYPPVLSQPLEDLPPGFVTINVGHETYYYYNGVFYQMDVLEQKYVAVPPPIGAVVFSIPFGYQLMFMDGTYYYLDQGVYYKRVLEGYRVVFPPV